MTAHVLLDCPGIGKPGCLSNGDVECMVCLGRLALCTVCNGADGGMPSECPGAQMRTETADAVYAGTLDYKNGHWIVMRSNVDPWS